MTDVFLGDHIGLPKSRLGLPEHNRVELTTFAWQNQIITIIVTRRESRNVTEKPE